MSLVSIIIPTHNRAHLIKDTLDSILLQTYENWECIIVDDGSTDNTDEIVNYYVIRDLRFKYYKRPHNLQKGANACRNYGFEISKGKYVNWFDSDDIMLEDFIKVKVNMFDDSISMVICSGYSVDSQLNILNKIDLSLNSELFKDYTLWKLKVFTPSILFRKEFLLKFKLFNLDYHRGQETEFFSRLFYKLSITEYVIINQPLFKYRQHIDTITNRNKQYVKSYIKSLTFNSVTNMNRGVSLKDYEIIEFHYRLLLAYFSAGLSNNDKVNSRFIAIELSKMLSRIHLLKAIKFFIVSMLMLFGVGRNKFKTILKHEIF